MSQRAGTLDAIPIVKADGVQNVLLRNQPLDLGEVPPGLLAGQQPDDAAGRERGQYSCCSLRDSTESFTHLAVALVFTIRKGIL